MLVHFGLSLQLRSSNYVDSAIRVSVLVPVFDVPVPTRNQKPVLIRHRLQVLVPVFEIPIRRNRFYKRRFGPGTRCWIPTWYVRRLCRFLSCLIGAGIRCLVLIKVQVRINQHLLEPVPNWHQSCRYRVGTGTGTSGHG